MAEASLVGKKFADKVRQKLKYGVVMRLGPIERTVLAATPDTYVGNNFATATEIADVVGLATRQVSGALSRPLEKEYVECVRPFDDLLTTWTSFPFFEKFPDVAKELFPDHKTSFEKLQEAYKGLRRR